MQNFRNEIIWNSIVGEIKYNIYCKNNEYKEIEFVISFKAIVCNKLLLFFQFSIDFLAYKTIINWKSIGKVAFLQIIDRLTKKSIINVQRRNNLKLKDWPLSHECRRHFHRDFWIVKISVIVINNLAELQTYTLQLLF